MNAMGHDVPNLIGIDQTDLTRKIAKLIPGYMGMGSKGMAEMGEMQMPLPANTLPMMTGDGPYGSLAMGGMFSLLKVRKEQMPGDYSDPGWFKHPLGTQAKEWQGPVPQATIAAPSPETEGPALQVRKPMGHDHH